MIKKGSLVSRKPDGYCAHLRGDIFKNDYPPAGEVCIVVSTPKEKDLSYQLRRVSEDYIALKKAIDVIYCGALFELCDMALFEEVKPTRGDGAAIE